MHQHFLDPPPSRRAVSHVDRDPQGLRQRHVVVIGFVDIERSRKACCAHAADLPVAREVVLEKAVAAIVADDELGANTVMRGGHYA